MKIKHLILLSLLCSFIFAFFSCSDDDGNTGGGGMPKIHGEKTTGNGTELKGDSLTSIKTEKTLNSDDNESVIPDDGNTGGGGMPKSN